MNLIPDDLELDLGRHFESLILLVLGKDSFKPAIEPELPPFQEFVEIFLQFEVDLDGLALFHDGDAGVLPAFDERLYLHADSECLGRYIDPTSSRQG